MSVSASVCTCDTKLAKCWLAVLSTHASVFLLE